MKLESLINERDLLRNEYEYKGMFADLYIYGKDNHRLLLENIKGMSGTYKLYDNFLSNKEGSLRGKSLYYGLQLDLFKD